MSPTRSYASSSKRRAPLQLHSPWQKAAAGAGGAAANEILRFFLVTTGKEAGLFIPSDVGVYLIATSLYLVLAGGFTILWDDPNPVKCFAIGVGLPRIIKSLAESGLQVPPTVSLLLT